MEITNEKLYIELLKIKKLIQESLDLQREMSSEEDEIKIFEGRQAEEEKLLAEAVKRRKFNTLMDWKGAIWDHCPSRKEQLSQNTVSFYCELLRGPCKFESCPRNLLEELP